MLRRSILGLTSRSSRRSIARIPRKIAYQQTPGKNFSTASPKNASPISRSSGNPAKSEGRIPKLIIGGTAIAGAGAGAAFVAYQYGYLDRYFHRDDLHDKVELLKTVGDNEKNKEALDLAETSKDESRADSLNLEAGPQIKANGDVSPPEFSSETKDEERSDVKDELPEHDRIPDSQVPHVEIADIDSSEPKASMEPKEGVEIVGNTTESDEAKVAPQNSVEDKIVQKTPKSEEVKVAPQLQENAPNERIEPPSPLLNAYNLEGSTDKSTTISLNEQGSGEHQHPLREEASVSAAIQENDGYINGKLVVDFLQAIHAAEEIQAELDAHTFAEEKRALEEKYERELKDSRARELMIREEAAILEKELKREEKKAAADIKALQEKMEDQRRKELERKESEANSKLETLRELAKAELTAAIVSEKAAQIEKMAEADIHINALCMAFNARSDESRQTHSAHKLALGALALDDALSRGLPVMKEVNALRNSLEGIDRDSFLETVLSSVPEEAQHYGTETTLQLNNKFDSLKATIRHFSLIPPGGGGLLTHSLAHFATLIKVKEQDNSGDGIESVINRVESFLSEGKLAEAADALDEGVRGSQAEAAVVDWVRHARNRAITEQALSVIQAYATCISS